MAPTKQQSMEEIIKKLDELLIKVDKLENLSLKKEKGKRVKHEYKTPDDSNRCTELKKDGTRCKGKLAKNNDKLCQIHLNAKNGVDPLAAKRAKAAAKSKANA